MTQLPSPVQSDPPPLLDGLSVIEVGEGLPLAYAGKVLAGAGAAVIKVEPPAGDPLRRWLRPSGAEYGPLFAYLNAGKQSVTLDLAEAGATRALAALAGSASTVIHALRASQAAELGLTYGELSAANPALVVTSLTPYGASGPYSELPATELTTFALSSRLHDHGSVEREPISYAPEVLEYQVGLSAALATLGAIFGAELSGVGQDVDVSAAEALTGNVDQWLLSWSFSQHKTPRMGGAAQRTFPMGSYPTADGLVLFASSGGTYFERVCRAIERTDLITDERFSSPITRNDYRDDFDAIFLPWLLERGRDDVVRIMQAAGVLCAPVLTLDTALDDTQLRARSSLVHVPGSPYPELVYPARPYLLSDAAPETLVPAPGLGEHNHLLEGLA